MHSFTVMNGGVPSWRILESGLLTLCVGPSGSKLPFFIMAVGCMLGFDWTCSKLCWECFQCRWCGVAVFTAVILVVYLGIIIPLVLNRWFSFNVRPTNYIFRIVFQRYNTHMIYFWGFAVFVWNIYCTKGAYITSIQWWILRDMIPFKSTQSWAGDVGGVLYVSDSRVLMCSFIA